MRVERGGGAEQRAAILLWELASEGIPLSSNSRKIAPGMEISRREWRFLVLQHTVTFLLRQVLIVSSLELCRPPGRP